MSNITVPITWANPPKLRGASKTNWDEIAAALKERPDTWALVASVKSPSTVNQIKRGALVAFSPAGAFESRGSKTGDMYDIYARFVGAQS